jgi:hypothetical protein
MSAIRHPRSRPAGLPSARGPEVGARDAAVQAPPPGVPAQAVPPRGGRPRLFAEATVRLNLFVPEQTAKQIRHLAIDLGLSPSQLVDAWARKAELEEAVARGREDVAEGRVVDQAEAERILARWA